MKGYKPETFYASMRVCLPSVGGGGLWCRGGAASLIPTIYKEVHSGTKEGIHPFHQKLVEENYFAVWCLLCAGGGWGCGGAGEHTGMRITHG